MKMKTVDFITSAPSIREAPSDGRAEIVFLGRSNVGKSSLINALTQRKKLAHTSNTPGKTRLMNYYLVNENFYLVDFPGYGYAKVSKSIQQEWQKNFEEYLLERDSIKLACLLVDSRHTLQNNDRQMWDYLDHCGFPLQLVLTKFDKLKANDRKKQKRKLAEAFGVQESEVITFSTQDKNTHRNLWSRLERALAK